jgi:hypothetical protein
MKKVIPAFFILYLFISCTNRLYYSSDWQSKKVTVDGKTPEWSNPLRFYDEKNRISYTISNDRQNLYLCCRISDELLQTKIMSAGLEFGIDTLGKKSFPINIKYPVGIKSNPESKRNTSPQAKSGSIEKSDRSFFNQKLLTEAREMQLVGFKPPIGRIISLSDPTHTGILAAINFDSRGNMYYEAVIPFSTFYKNELTPADSNKIFNYRIRVDALLKLYKNENNSSGMRGNEMRGGGIGEDGMRGDRMGRGMNGRSMYGANEENGFQRNTATAGLTRTTIKLKLAFK